jgi:hypothetical protein
MKHFGPGPWADFARGLLSGEQAREMQAHAQACLACRRTAEVLRKLAEFARAEGTSEPPPEVVGRAKAIFQRWQPKSTGFAGGVFRVLYHSFRQPLPAGVRAMDRPYRVLYGAGDYALDVQIEPEHGTSRCALVGQIANQLHPDDRLPNVPVMVVSGERVVASALSNAHGEFHLTYPPREGLRLRVFLRDGEGAEIPLPRLGSWESP